MRLLSGSRERVSRRSTENDALDTASAVDVCESDRAAGQAQQLESVRVRTLRVVLEAKIDAFNREIPNAGLRRDDSAFELGRVGSGACTAHGRIACKGGVIRRSDFSVLFYITVGMILLIPATVVGMMTGLLQKLINWNL